MYQIYEINQKYARTLMISRTVIAGRSLRKRAASVMILRKIQLVVLSSHHVAILKAGNAARTVIRKARFCTKGKTKTNKARARDAVLAVKMAYLTQEKKERDTVVISRMQKFSLL